MRYVTFFELVCILTIMLVGQCSAFYFYMEYKEANELRQRQQAMNDLQFSVQTMCPVSKIEALRQQYKQY